MLGSDRLLEETAHLQRLGALVPDMLGERVSTWRANKKEDHHSQRVPGCIQVRLTVLCVSSSLLGMAAAETGCVCARV
jgi:hypothetical protein